MRTHIDKRKVHWLAHLHMNWIAYSSSKTMANRTLTRPNRWWVNYAVILHTIWNSYLLEHHIGELTLKVFNGLTHSLTLDKYRITIIFWSKWKYKFLLFPTLSTFLMQFRISSRLFRKTLRDYLNCFMADKKVYASPIKMWKRFTKQFNVIPYFKPWWFVHLL